MKCSKCGNPFDPRVAEVARQTAGRPITPVHVCGDCRTFHVETEGGALRAMTAGEMFALRMEYSGETDFIDAIPPDCEIPFIVDFNRGPAKGR